MEHQTNIMGDFIEPDEGIIEGRMSIIFQSGKLNIDELWQSSSLSAKFLSTFWGTFFPERDASSGSTRKKVEDEVHYITSELLGNAVKFSYEPKYLIEISLNLHPKELRIYVKNSVESRQLERFQSFIQRVLTEDTEQLFFEQMEKSAKEDSNESGVGFLTLINDYGASLAWKFQTMEDGVHVVTTMAKMPVTRE